MYMLLDIFMQKKDIPSVINKQTFDTFEEAKMMQ